MYGLRMTAGLVLACMLTAAHADDVTMLHGKPSKEQIIEVLGAPPAPKGLRTRGLSLGSQQEAPQAPVQKALDLEVRFDFNSDQLTQEGKDVLDQLAAALGSEQLHYVRHIILEGHTDAVGSDAYNRDLSRRRAESVRAYLSSVHATGGRSVNTVGKGASEPADGANPSDAVNRRVRIIVNG